MAGQGLELGLDGQRGLHRRNNGNSAAPRQATATMLLWKTVLKRYVAHMAKEPKGYPPTRTPGVGSYHSLMARGQPSVMQKVTEAMTRSMDLAIARQEWLYKQVWGLFIHVHRLIRRSTSVRGKPTSAPGPHPWGNGPDAGKADIASVKR